MKTAVILASLALLSAPLYADVALDTLKKAHKGDVAAMRKIGYMKFQGKGTQQDRKNGLAWLKKAADMGDAQAMYYLGCIYAQGGYVGQNMEEAERYLRAASQKGEERATKKLAQLAEAENGKYSDASSSATQKGADKAMEKPALLPAAEASEAPDAPPATTSKNALKNAAKQIADNMQAQGFKSVSLTAFLCNGGRTNELTTALRDLLLENFMDIPSLDVYDRLDSKIVATENGLACNDDNPALDAASVVMVGEVFCQPGDKYGYFTYRVFGAKDTRVVAAGCERIRWTTSEQDLFYGHVRQKADKPLSYIRQADLDKIGNQVSNRVKVGIAVVQDGAMSEENTLDCRLAYAQVLATLMKRGCRLFEREFMRQAGTEMSMVDGVVEGGDGVGAVGRIKLTQGAGNENTLKLQVSAVPGGRLLSAVTFSQVKGSTIGSSVGNNDENKFESMLDNLDQADKDVKLQYECEVLITDDYSAPELEGESTIPTVNENGGCRYSDYTPSAACPARTMLTNFTKEAYRRVQSKEEVKRMIEYAALIGFETDQGVYVGPLNICLLEAKKFLMYNKKGSMPEKLNMTSLGSDILERGKRGLEPKLKLPSGEFESRWNPKFRYNTSIQWKDGLPYKVKCSIDFTPSKKDLIKREK